MTRRANEPVHEPPRSSLRAQRLSNTTTAHARSDARRIAQSWIAAVAIAVLPGCRRRTAQPTGAPHDTLPRAPQLVDAATSAALRDAGRDDASRTIRPLADWTRLRAMTTGMTGGNDWTVMPDGRGLVLTLSGGLGGGPPASDEVTVPPATLGRLNAILADPALARELADAHCANNGRITDVTAQITIDTPEGDVDREVSACLYDAHPSPPIAALFEVLRTMTPPATRSAHGTNRAGDAGR